MKYLVAFLVGGIICALVQILMDQTKLLPGRIMVILVCLGALFGAIGLYEPFLEFAGQGAGTVLLGFGNTLFRGVKEEINSNGFIGIFTGGLKACAAGISSALIFGYVMSIFFDSKIN